MGTGLPALDGTQFAKTVFQLRRAASTCPAHSVGPPGAERPDCRIVEYSVTTWVGNLTRFHIKVDVPCQHIEG